MNRRPLSRIRAPLAVSIALALVVGCGSDLAGETAADTTAQTRLAVAEMAAPTASGGVRAAANRAARIPSRYIVVFKQDTTDPRGRANAMTRAAGGQLHFSYADAIKGFAATLPEAALQRVLQDTSVEYVEEDQVIQLSQTSEPVTQTTRYETFSLWGLDRIDQVSSLDSRYSYTSTGAGVAAYVIDTGIRATHTDFADRVATTGFTAFNDGVGTGDCNGHGTHVAGTIGGTTVGVAKSVQLVPVRVLDCAGSGSISGVIAGVDWVRANAAKPAVANMSLGGGASSALDTAVANAVTAGITMVVAAGNSNANACNYSPARAPSAITVGATQSNDARSSYSNYGSCVDVFAPGSSITSTWYTADNALNTLNGTSMAAPHVAGVAALLLQAQPLATPADIANTIRSGATSGRLTSIGTGSPNLLLYSLASFAPVTDVSASGLSATVKTSSRSWSTTVTISVVQTGSSTPVAGATVRGLFSGNSTVRSCTTGSSGSCSVTSHAISNSRTSTTFSISSIAGSGLGYSGDGLYAITVAKTGGFTTAVR